MKAPTVILLTLSGFNGIYRVFSDPPQTEEETKLFYKEIILDSLSYTLVIIGTEWLASQNSKVLKVFAWTPVITSALVAIACLLIIIRAKLKQRRNKSKNNV